MIDLHAALNRPTYPATGQPQLLYALLEPRLPGRGASAPVNLGLVIDVSASMRIPLLTPGQFEELAGQGLVHEVIADGIPVWQFENITTASLKRYPRPIDYVADALKVCLLYTSPYRTSRAGGNLFESNRILACSFRQWGASPKENWAT